ncbi:NEAT domain-containing protein [Geosporobacter ferrireducens]|uniref:NEAT domain-containing protein n=1 Tax=Geosporobacter ferrireducens TaxID=1424294 RepID=UPI0023527610|nr:NEAT domain-containing protein [Geosporobacter ferrireducens]
MKRLLSAWLVFVMVLTMIPAAAFAVDTELFVQGEQDGAELSDHEESEEASGGTEHEASEEESGEVGDEAPEEEAGEAGTEAPEEEFGEAESEVPEEEVEHEVPEEQTGEIEVETPEEEAGLPPEAPESIGMQLAQVGIMQVEAVIDINIQAPPAKTTYTAGEELDLTGLTVTLKKDDASTEDVAFEDFESREITTDPANGTMLAKEDTKITIIHTASGKSVEQLIAVNPAEEVLADGKYKIDVRAWNATNDAASMMAGMLEKEAVLEVAGGKIYATIKFVKAAIMNIPVTGESVQEVWPEPTGTPVVGTGVKGTVNPAEESQTFRFEISTLDMPRLAMFVGAPMNSTQTIRLNFDQSSIEPDSTEAAVTEIAVKTAPTKTTYTAGEKLNLTGLAVTLKKDNGSTEDITFADFGSKGITTTPANEAVLAEEDIKIMITHAGSGKTVEQVITINPAEEALADGKYKIDVRAWHATNDAASMMAGMLEKEAALEVVGGKIYATIKFIKTTLYGQVVTGESVKEVWPEPVGTPVIGTGLKGTVNPEEESQAFRFEISTLDMPRLAMYTTSIQTIRLNFDASTIEKIGDADPEGPKEPNLEGIPAKEIVSQGEAAVIELQDIENLGEEEIIAVKFNQYTVILPVKLLKEQLSAPNVLGVRVVKEAVSGAIKNDMQSVLASKDSILEDFDLKVQKVFSNGVLEDVHELKNRIKVAIQLIDEQTEAISKAEAVKLYYYNAEANKLEDMQASFDMAAKKAVFYTDHLSVYLIAITEKTEAGGGTGNPKLDPENLPDGSYTLNAKALKENSEELSMCDELIWGRLGLSVYSGAMEVTMLLKGTEYIPLKEVKEIKYKNKAGSYVEASWSYDEGSNTITARFPVESITKPQYMQVSVPAVMPLKPIFRLVFNVNSLQEGGKMNDPSSIANTVKEITITATAGEGGSIDPEGEVKVIKGSDQTFTIRADEGYQIKDVLVDDKSVGAVETYTFEKVEKEARISVIFEKIEEVLVPVLQEEEPEEEVVFTDIQGHWAEKFIQQVVRKGIFIGTSEDTFSPDRFMTRGMLVTVLGKFHGAAVEAYEADSFKDVNPEQYYAKFVEWAVDAGIVKGIGEDQFGPDRPITREELAVMFVNYARFAGIRLEEIKLSESPEADFEDEAFISPWAKDSVRLMKQSGLMSGKTNNRFEPRGTATRAEAAMLIAKVLDVLEGPADAEIEKEIQEDTEE